MVETVLGAIIQVLTLLALPWVALALLGLKWRWLRRARQGYGRLLRTLLLAIVGWLWLAPRVPREGIGQVAQSRLPYGDENYPEEEDSWV